VGRIFPILAQPAAQGILVQVQFAGRLGDAQAMVADQANRFELELPGKTSS